MWLTLGLLAGAWLMSENRVRRSVGSETVFAGVCVTLALLFLLYTSRLA